ncbi:MAG: type ISP restriction/modification enzyme [Flammeovirgaceae bacterium]
MTLSEPISTLVRKPSLFEEWLQHQVQAKGYTIQSRTDRKQTLMHRLGYAQGEILHIANTIPYAAQKQASNLLIVHHDYLSLWQDGIEVDQVGWESERKWKQLGKLFFDFNPCTQLTENHQHYLQSLGALQEQLLTDFQSPTHASAEYEKAFRKVYHYLRQHINPQASKHDVFFFASQFAIFYPIIHAHFSSTQQPKHLNHFHKLGELAFSATTQSVLTDAIATGVALFQQLTAHATQQERQWQILWELGRDIAQVIGKKFTQKNIGHLPEVTQFLPKAQEDSLTATVSWDSPIVNSKFINSALFLPYLLLIHHPQLKETSIHWANSLLAGDYEEAQTQHPIFAQQLASNHQFQFQKQQQLNLIIGDFTNLYHDKSERGHSQAYENSTAQHTPFLIHSSYKQPKLPSYLKQFTWAIERLAIGGTICCLAPEALLLTDELDGVRTYLAAQFQEIKIITASDTYQAKQGFWLILSHKNVQPTSCKLSIATSSPNLQWESIEAINGFWGHPSWNAYLQGIPIIRNQTKKTALQVFDKVAIESTPTDCSVIIAQQGQHWTVLTSSMQQLVHLTSEQHYTLSPSTLSKKVITHFQDYYGAKIPVIKGIEAKHLLQAVQEIMKFSKQLPVIHKYSTQLFNLLPKAQTQLIKFKDFEEIRAVIDRYTRKIKQLAKGAQERKSLFQRITLQLNCILERLRAQEELQVKNEQLRAAINSENSFYYCYYALAKFPIDYSSSSLLKLAPRVILNHDFHQWAMQGKALYQLNQFELPSTSTASKSTESIALKLSKDLTKIQIDHALSIENIPQEAWKITLFDKSILSLFLKSSTNLFEQFADKKGFYDFSRRLIDNLSNSYKTLIIND